MQNTTRLDYVDIAKGFGMLFVIWGHIMLAGWSNHFVYGFHMPLFFFLSGMMFRKEKYESLSFLLKRRFTTLIKPYLAISFVTWSIWAVYSYITHGHVEIFYFYLCNAKTPLVFIICVVCTVIGWAMIQPNDFFNFKKLPWNMEAGFSAIIFYAMGNKLTERFTHERIIECISKKKLLYGGVVVLFTVLLLLGTLYNGHVTLGTHILGKNVFAFYFTSICGIISIVFFSMLVSIESVRKYMRIVIDYVQWIGRNSFLRYGIPCPNQRLHCCYNSETYPSSGSSDCSNRHEIIACCVCGVFVDYVCNCFYDKFCNFTL